MNAVISAKLLSLQNPQQFLGLVRTDCFYSPKLSTSPRDATISRFRTADV